MFLGSKGAYVRVLAFCLAAGGCCCWLAWLWAWATLVMYGVVGFRVHILSIVWVGGIVLSTGCFCRLAHDTDSCVLYGILLTSIACRMVGCLVRGVYYCLVFLCLFVVISLVYHLGSIVVGWIGFGSDRLGTTLCLHIFCSKYIHAWLRGDFYSSLAGAVI